MENAMPEAVSRQTKKSFRVVFFVEEIELYFWKHGCQIENEITFVWAEQESLRRVRVPVTTTLCRTLWHGFESQQWIFEKFICLSWVLQMLEKVSGWKRLDCNAGHQEFHRCRTKDVSQESTVHRWQSTQVGDPPWLWNPGHTSPEDYLCLE